MRPDIKYWIALSKINGLGPAKFKKIYAVFESMAAAWSAGRGEWQKTNLDEKLIDEILYQRHQINPDEELDKMTREQIEAVTAVDEDYPKLLKEIHNSPAILYYRGQLKHEGDQFSLGIVGTRKFSKYGKRVVDDIVRELAKQSITTVSGLALGIDALVHEATLAGNGRTIAVIGSGLDKQNIYPSLNRYMADQIVDKGGLVVSEYPIGTMPLKQHFPQRNRIISGLSAGVLVVEAPESSGALITAQFAVEQNRDVLAVPGDIYSPNSAGPHNLIKLGAKLVASAADILEALNLGQAAEFVQAREILPDTDEEKKILDVLTEEPIHINDLIKQSGLDTPAANSTIILMEMKGKVRNLGGMNYVRGR